MTEPEAILAAIIIEPADDVARLVYADRLDDTGEDADARRAAFIRSQIHYGMIADFTMTVSDVYNLRYGVPKGSFYPTVGEGRIPWPRDLVGQATAFREWEWMRPNASCSITYVRGFVAKVMGPYRLILEGLPTIANNPITWVSVMDKSPEDRSTWVNDKYAPHWGWFCFDRQFTLAEEDPEDIDRAVFDLMPGGDFCSVSGMWKLYATDGDARLALQKGLLAWSRRKAKVEPTAKEFIEREQSACYDMLNDRG